MRLFLFAVIYNEIYISFQKWKESAPMSGVRQCVRSGGLAKGYGCTDCLGEYKVSSAIFEVMELVCEAVKLKMGRRILRAYENCICLRKY